MPLLKIYVDEAIGAAKVDRLAAALPSLRELLCRELAAEVPACQFAVIPVRGLPDQAPLSVEMQLLPKPERGRDVLLSVGGQLRGALAELVEEKVAVRITTLDPATYIALR